MHTLRPKDVDAQLPKFGLGGLAGVTSECTNAEVGEDDRGFIH